MRSNSRRLARSAATAALLWLLGASQTQSGPELARRGRAAPVGGLGGVGGQGERKRPPPSWQVPGEDAPPPKQLRVPVTVPVTAARRPREHMEWMVMPPPSQEEAVARIPGREGGRERQCGRDPPETEGASQDADAPSRQQRIDHELRVL